MSGSHSRGTTSQHGIGTRLAMIDDGKRSPISIPSWLSVNNLLNDTSIQFGCFDSRNLEIQVTFLSSPSAYAFWMVSPTC